MKILQVDSLKDGRITLTRERWNHIVRRHPEMEGRLQEIRGTLEQPDVIEKSRTGRKSHVYYKRTGANYLTVPVHVEKQFIKTAYIARNRKGGEMIWRS